MVTKTCGTCGESFTQRDKRRKFCSVGCYSAVRRERRGGESAFVPGAPPWNKGKKIGSMSPATEFKKGQKPHNYLPVGTIRIRPDKSGRPRRFIKIRAKVWKEYARWIWIGINGSLGRGLIVHHLDGDALNDSPENLLAMTRSEHIKVHRRDLENGKK